jgi:RimJ/RimL family protein N-acetyltransferase
MENHSVTMVRENMNDIPEIPFPEGYGIRYFRSGEGYIWTRIQKAAEPFFSIEDSLFNREFGDHLNEMPDRSFFVINNKEEEIGTITAWWKNNWKGKDWGMIHWVAIHPQHQRRGLAKSAMSVAMKRLKRSHDRCMLNTSTGRIAAIKVYLDFGFQPYIDSEEKHKAWRQLASVLEHPTLKKMQL